MKVMVLVFLTNFLIPIIGMAGLSYLMVKDNKTYYTGKEISRRPIKRRKKQ
jgi:uncharacterized paraquat-inducible protein A